MQPNGGASFSLTRDYRGAIFMINHNSSLNFSRGKLLYATHTHTHTNNTKCNYTTSMHTLSLPLYIYTLTRHKKVGLEH